MELKNALSPRALNEYGPSDTTLDRKEITEENLVQLIISSTSARVHFATEENVSLNDHLQLQLGFYNQLKAPPIHRTFPDAIYITKNHLLAYPIMIRDGNNINSSIRYMPKLELPKIPLMKFTLS